MSETLENIPAAEDAARFDIMMRLFDNPDQRMATLYYVLDENGKRVLYRRRPAQLEYAENQWVLDVIVKSRQLGFSTEIALEICDLCVFHKNMKAGIIDYTLRDAQMKLQKIKFAYSSLPADVRAIVRLTKDNEDEIWFSNGSSVVVGTSHRGGTLQYLHISEFGKIAAEKPDIANEIVNGAFNTVAPGSQIKVESTAHGTSGKFYDLVRRSEAKLKEGRKLTPLDFKLHFFGWWQDPKYQLQASLVTISPELREYFGDLHAKHGITLTPDQQAWYTNKYEQLGKDEMASEFPSHIDECFYNSLEGTWFKSELSKAREERRIGYPVPYDRTRRVNTFWDKGINEKNDQNAIWFHQTDGVRHRFIDYYENSGEGIQHYAAKVKEIGEKRGFVYGVHYGPHDLEQRMWVDNARPMKEMAADLGIVFKIVPRILVKEDAIEAARRMLNLSWFDSENTARGVECLDNYRKMWDNKLAQWTRVPLHNWASNAADAAMTGAVGLKPDAVETADGRSRKRQQPLGSQWSR